MAATPADHRGDDDDLGEILARETARRLRVMLAAGQLDPGDSIEEVADLVAGEVRAEALDHARAALGLGRYAN